MSDRTGPVLNKNRAGPDFEARFLFEDRTGPDIGNRIFDLGPDRTGPDRIIPELIM